MRNAPVLARIVPHSLFPNGAQNITIFTKVRCIYWYGMSKIPQWAVDIRFFFGVNIKLYLHENVFAKASFPLNVSMGREKFHTEEFHECRLSGQRLGSNNGAVVNAAHPPRTKTHLHIDCKRRRAATNATLFASASLPFPFKIALSTALLTRVCNWKTSDLLSRGERQCTRLHAFVLKLIRQYESFCYNNTDRTKVLARLAWLVQCIGCATFRRNEHYGTFA